MGAVHVDGFQRVPTAHCIDPSWFGTIRIKSNSATDADRKMESLLDDLTAQQEPVVDAVPTKSPPLMRAARFTATLLAGLLPCVSTLTITAHYPKDKPLYLRGSACGLSWVKSIHYHLEGLLLMLPPG